MPGSVSGYVMDLPLFQWDLLKGKQILQESQGKHFLHYVPLPKM